MLTKWQFWLLTVLAVFTAGLVAASMVRLAADSFRAS